MEWTNEKVIEFLEILQGEPCLWDPRNKAYKNRASQNDAWRRLLDILPFSSKVEELKKKKESLFGYYRTHLSKHKKSLKSGAGTNEIYTTNWFAYEIMDRFFRGIYESNRTLNTETNEESEGRDNHNFELRSETNTNNKIQEHNVAIIKTQDFSSTTSTSRKKHLKENLPPEIQVAQRQMNEAFEYLKSNKDDEYEMFGRLIASKLKKIKNPNTREILMNDIHNLVFRTSMMDLLEQSSAVPASFNPTSISQAADLQTYLSPPNSTTPQSPHHQIHSPSPGTSSHQSPPGRFSQEPFQVLSPRRPSQIVITESGEIKIVEDAI